MKILARLDPWITEFTEIIDLSLGLFKSDFESGSRVAVVLLDNCVEFMFKAYLRVKKHVVGSGKKYPIKYNEWESETSRRFDKLLEAMKNHSNLSQDLIDEADHYHTIRNELYHTATPVKTSDSVFKEQLKLTLKILERLYSVKHKVKAADLDIGDFGKGTPEQMLDSIIKPMPGNPKALNLNVHKNTSFSQIIRIVLYGFQKIVGNYASVDQLFEMLRLNMKSASEKRIRATLAELKQRKHVEEKEKVFILTDLGHKIMIQVLENDQG